MVGQAPWAYTYPTWYHRYNDLSFGVLRAASKLGEYTLVDRDTWLAIEPDIRDSMMVFVKIPTVWMRLAYASWLAETFNADKDDPLLNPAHALVGTYGANKDQADTFAEWLSATGGGQKVIETSAVGENVLYALAPKGVDPFGRVEKIAKLTSSEG